MHNKKIKIKNEKRKIYNCKIKKNMLHFILVLQNKKEVNENWK